MRSPAYNYCDAWRGFVFSILLRRLGTEREYLLVNAWESQAAVQSWTATDAEANLRAKAKGILAEPLESLGEYEEVHL
jgi:heme-degrading monooxygenase HmoA